MARLTKDGLKGLSISFNKARALGLTDEQLSGISENGTTKDGKIKYRIFVRDKDRLISENGRPTATEYDILDAVKTKQKMLQDIENARKNHNKAKHSIADASITVAEGIKKFMIHREILVNSNNLAFTTFEDDEEVINGRFIRDNKLLSMKVIEVTVADAQEYTDNLWLATNITDFKQGEKLSENTIYKPFALLRKVFQYFIDTLKILDENPFVEVKNKPKYTPQTQGFLIDKEIQVVIDNLPRKNIRFQCFINLLLEAGDRLEENLAITWKDINRLRESIGINSALRKSKRLGKYVVKGTKNKNSEREVCFTPYIFELLDKYRMFKVACGFIVSDDDLVFTAWDSNEPVNLQRYSNEWKEFSKEIGITVIPLKNIRHTNTTYMMKDNPNGKDVQVRLGHKKFSTTQGIYNQAGNYYDNRKLATKFGNEFRNAFGLTIAELYMISVNRLSDKRKLYKFLQDMSGKLVDDSNFDEVLKNCQQILFNLYPIFKKIAVIDNQLDNAEVIAIFDGFKAFYYGVQLDSSLYNQIN